MVILVPQRSLPLLFVSFFVHVSHSPRTKNLVTPGDEVAKEFSLKLNNSSPKITQNLFKEFPAEPQNFEIFCTFKKNLLGKILARLTFEHISCQRGMIKSNRKSSITFLKIHFFGILNKG